MPHRDKLLMPHNNIPAMNLARTGLLAVLACFSLSSHVLAGVITYIAPKDAYNSSATWPAVGGTFNQNFGIAFTTGSGGSFDIDWITLRLNTCVTVTGSGSLTVALRNTNNTTAYSAVAGTTEYAKDTVSFSKPTTQGTNFEVNLTAPDLQNISGFSLQPNTTYSLIFYAPSENFAIARTTGYANGTTNDQYVVSNGFTMLDTFRNNSPNYTNTSGSYPSLHISFGADTGAPTVPEPGTLSLSALGLVGLGVWNRMRRRQA